MNPLSISDSCTHLVHKSKMVNLEQFYSNHRKSLSTLQFPCDLWLSITIG